MGGDLAFVLWWTDAEMSPTVPDSCCPCLCVMVTLAARMAPVTRRTGGMWQKR